jgi:homogentisate 1,2-dioxygenase
MTYTEKFTWQGKELVVQRETSPVAVVSAESKQMKLEKINVNDPNLRPSNYDKADGTILPILQADGVRVDLSKRSKAPMSFWHRNMECDELIFCFKGGIRWETELGNIALGPGEMFVIPKGIAHRSLLPENSEGENIIVEFKIRGDISKLI